ncbi:transcription factor MYC2-like, partial [Trifolium medium]|nr:transcription factor MYC2-like [Trifolium medium]
STLTATPSAVAQRQNQNQSFFPKELNFSNSLKPESGEILNFGESRKNSYSAGNGNFFTGQSQFAAGEENRKRRSPASRNSIDDGMLSFTSGVLLPASNMKPSGGGG